MQFVELPAGRDANPGNALQNLRDGFMVDRFTGARINRTIAGQANAVSMVTGDINNIDLTIQSVRDNADIAPGSYHISDRVIDLSAGALLADADGIHISFYNCTFVVTNYTADTAGGTVSSAHRFAFGITPLATDGARTSSARVNAAGNNQGTTRSINFYGCTIAQASTTERLELRCQLADAIGCDFRFAAQGPGGADIDIYPSPQVGGRWINNTFVTGQLRTDPASRIFTYGFPDVYEGIELYGLGIDVGLATDAVSGPRMLIEPNFSFPGQTTVYTFQTNGNPAFADGAAANLFQNIGFFTPASNANNDAGDVIAPRSAGYLRFENGAGGAINYAAYQPTYIDAITGNGIQNVKVRVNTSATLNDAAGTSTTAANFARRVNTPDSDQTITTNFIGSEYLTDTTGQLVSSMYTTDGWGSSTAGYYDPMIFDFRTDTTTNPSRLAQNSFTTPALTPPEHTALAVVQDIRGVIDNNSGNLTTSTFTRHAAQYEAFSWSHDILQELSESSTTLIDGTARGTQTAYGINRDVSRSAPSVIGTLVKEGFTASDNTPNLTALQGLFDQDDIPSINDVRMALRYERYQYNQHVRGNPQTNVIHLVVDNTHTPHWTTAINNTITVRGNGLAAKADDLYTADANIASIDLRGTYTISGLTLGTLDIGDGSRTQWIAPLHSSTLPAATNSTLIGEYDVQGTSGDIINITFNNCNLSGLTLLTPSGVTVNVRGTDNEGNPLNDSSFANPSGLFGQGTVNFPAPVVALTVETPDEPGTFGVIEVTGTSQTARNIVQAAMRTGGGTVGSYTIPSDNMTTHRFYWKRDNIADSTGVEGTGYATTIIERSNVDLPANTTEIMVASPYFDSLYSGDPALGTGSAAAPSEFPDPNDRTGFPTRAFSNNGMQVQVNNERTTTGGPSQYHMLTAMDNTTYLNVLLNNNRLTDVITPTSVSSVNADAQFIQVNTRNDGRQQQLVGVDFVNLQEMLEEVWNRNDLLFVDNLLGSMATPRFYFRDDTDILLDDERWPGSGIGADPITGYRIIMLDGTPTTPNPVIQTIRDIAGRFTVAELAAVTGEISIFNSAGQRRGRYSFEGIVVTDDEIRINLSAWIDGDTSGTLMQVGISAGNSTIEVAGFSRTAEQSDQVVPLTLGTTTVPSVILFPNPLGATPGQIQQAATNAINSSAAITETRNGVGYMIGTGGDSRLIGIKPRSGNYNSDTDYSGNL